MSKELHDQIMNLPCKRTASHFLSHEEMQLYKEGHRDARHAAAELAITADDTQAKLNAAHALLREVYEEGNLDIGDQVSKELDNRIHSYLDACDTLGMK